MLAEKIVQETAPAQGNRPKPDTRQGVAARASPNSRGGLNKMGSGYFTVW